MQIMLIPPAASLATEPIYSALGQKRYMGTRRQQIQQFWRASVAINA